VEGDVADVDDAAAAAVGGGRGEAVHDRSRRARA
jgi:hypothetical protein